MLMDSGPGPEGPSRNDKTGFPHFFTHSHERASFVPPEELHFGPQPGLDRGHAISTGGAGPVLGREIAGAWARCGAMKPEPGPPMTLGNAAAACVRLIVWCKACGHQVEPDPAAMAQRYGDDTPVIEWRERLVCSRCGSRNVDMVVIGTEMAVAASKARP